MEMVGAITGEGPFAPKCLRNTANILAGHEAFNAANILAGHAAFMNGLLLYLYSITVRLICRPSDHTVGRPGPRLEPVMGDIEARTLTTRPPHLLRRNVM